MAARSDLDMEKVETFAFKVINDCTAQWMGTLSTIAGRLNLWTALDKSGPVTSDEFAECAKINERYAREWLAAMACHGYIAYDDATKRFSLPPEHVLVLADPDSSFYLAADLALTEPFYSNVGALTEAFQHGGGVPQDRFGDNFWCALECGTRVGFHNNLVQDWIPAMPDVDAKLRASGSVADVGCGNGQALIYLAKGYPRATLVGYDAYAPAIAAANANAAVAGLADRLRFEVCDVTKGIPGTYDLITTFDVVHDMARPGLALKAIKQALNPGGTFFALEFNFSGDVQKNIDHPFGLGAYGYAASVNYCMTQSLAAGGEGIGTCMGEEKMRELATEAGFTHFQRLDIPSNPFNLFYEMRA